MQRTNAACKERMLKRMLGESFAFADSNNSLAIKERMRHPESGCLALTANDIAWENGFFGIPHFMKSLINDLGKDGF